MNKTVTSFWKGLFFRSNIHKVRKALIDYLSGEGVEHEVVDGDIVIQLDDCKYGVMLDVAGEYPQCSILFRMGDDDYEALELSQKTFIADKINVDECHYCTVKAFNDAIEIEAIFHFTNKKMLLSLFYDYFRELRYVASETMDLTSCKLKEKEEKRPIGFAARGRENKGDQDSVSKIVACTGQQ